MAAEPTPCPNCGATLPLASTDGTRCCNACPDCSCLHGRRWSLLSEQLERAEARRPKLIRLVLEGQPAIRHDPTHRAVGGRIQTFPDDRTKLGLARWHGVWQAAGAPWIEGPVEVWLAVYRVRPKSHHGVKGLNVTGRRFPMPTR